MNGYYGAATWLTYMNAVFGMIGIYFALTGNLFSALICLILSGICDMFDGTVAKRFDRTDQEKCYGIQIDSMADLVSFGGLPAIIGLTLGAGRGFSIAITILYYLAALIRLSYFNVTEMEFLNSGKSRAFYEGLPVTSVAVILPVFYFLCLYFKLDFRPVYHLLLGLIAFLFVSRIRIYKLNLRQMILAGTVGISTVIWLLKMVGGR